MRVLRRGKWWHGRSAESPGFARAPRLPGRSAVPAAGAGGSLAKAVPDQVARYGADVRGDVVADTGHWLFEERPDELTGRVLDFLRQP